MTSVLMVCDESLFGQGLVDLLRHQMEIELVDQVTDTDALSGFLEQCHPEVLLFGCSDPEHCPAPLFARSLRYGHVRRIICVHLEDNEAFVFRGERRTMEAVEDLMEAIAGQSPGTLATGVRVDQDP